MLRVCHLSPKGWFGTGRSTSRTAVNGASQRASYLIEWWLWVMVDSCNSLSMQSFSVLDSCAVAWCIGISVHWLCLFSLSLLWFLSLSSLSLFGFHFPISFPPSIIICLLCLSLTMHFMSYSVCEALSALKDRARRFSISECQIYYPLCGERTCWNWWHRFKKWKATHLEKKQ